MKTILVSLVLGCVFFAASSSQAAPQTAFVSAYCKYGNYYLNYTTADATESCGTDCWRYVFSTGTVDHYRKMSFTMRKYSDDGQKQYYRYIWSKVTVPDPFYGFYVWDTEVEGCTNTLYGTTARKYSAYHTYSTTSDPMPLTYGISKDVMKLKYQYYEGGDEFERRFAFIHDVTPDPE